MSWKTETGGTAATRHIPTSSGFRFVLFETMQGVIRKLHLLIV